MKMMLIAALMIGLPAIAVIGYGVVSNSYSIWPALFSLLAGSFPFILGAIWLRFAKQHGDDHGGDEAH